MGRYRKVPRCDDRIVFVHKGKKKRVNISFGFNNFNLRKFFYKNTHNWNQYRTYSKGTNYFHGLKKFRISSDDFMVQLINIPVPAPNLVVPTLYSLHASTTHTRYLITYLKISLKGTLSREKYCIYSYDHWSSSPNYGYPPVLRSRWSWNYLRSRAGAEIIFLSFFSNFLLVFI